MLTFLKNYNNLCAKLVYLFDIVLLILVISFFINDLFHIIFSICYQIYNFFNFNDVFCFMNNNSSNTINTQIIHDDGSWSNAIRSLFIYGSGGFRLWLQRGGAGPGSRFVIVGTTLAADTISRVITNAVNDPNYINNHIK